MITRRLRGFRFTQLRLAVSYGQVAGRNNCRLKQITDYAFRTFPLERLQASVFDWDPASARVLEKVGCVLEGRLQQPFQGRTPSRLAALRASSPLIGN